MRQGGLKTKATNVKHEPLKSRERMRVSKTDMNLHNMMETSVGTDGHVEVSLWKLGGLLSTEPFFKSLPTPPSLNSVVT